MNLFDILSRQRRFVYLVVSVLSAAGVWAALALPSAIYPETQISRNPVAAQGSSPGAPQGYSRPVPGVTARA